MKLSHTQEIERKTLNSSQVERVGCPRMTQLLKCYAPDAFSGAKFQVFLENGHEIDVG